MLMRRLLDGERFDHDGPPTRCTTPCAPRARSRSTCRSSSAVAAGARRCAPSPSGPTAGTRRATSRGPRRDLRPSRSTAADVGRDLATIEKTISFPIVIRDDRAADAQARMDELLRGQRRRAHGRRAAPRRLAGRGGRRDPARTAISGSGRSSCGCRRPTTARPSSGSARSASRSTDEGRRCSPAASVGRSWRRAWPTHVGPDLTVVVNTGDDLERHGLAVWPDSRHRRPTRWPASTTTTAAGACATRPGP